VKLLQNCLPPDRTPVASGSESGEKTNKLSNNQKINVTEFSHLKFLMEVKPLDDGKSSQI